MILALETSSPNCEISFLKDNKEVFSIFADTHSKHEKNLILLLDFSLKYLNISLKDIELIGISIGPGNFTALRVGLATSFGLSYPYNIPLKGINTLDALYHTCLYYFEEIKEKKVVCVIDAKRETLYSAVYQNQKRLTDYQLISITKFPSLFPQEEVDFICGSGILFYPELFNNYKKINIYYPKAKIIGLLAQEAKKEGKLDAPFSLSPFYLKEPDIRK
ncbi:MAG: tRNA (adenosine(37)-N6)-threonylcarbamoyltransferase complex dimerization subunit type 1 TsaB [candidate division WOR-3 bacterium]|nr:tRNA (adenosine(37)-N6)-threonylcarbamoyltransferase complex dimerization subunit type 1 TsaB [candidate division WOR-3 bacterium]MCX7836665.1 tRNA (adenosine(37)-N6)-threonylcarbamoyltransferase complex dimerization subunit type 1 TsaB [candidate division WOR-3 bacterium]MDW8113694.1 tRNA (adenosine(37)-N6)-threonylcarbamoyltransferase complex dimerization subunit type 1 TsaB [candidate division WOR-3 bacterium]